MRTTPRLDPVLPDAIFASPRGSPKEAPRKRSEDARPAAARSFPGLPTIGSVVDKYRLEELLGIGGFAAVYRATHLILKTTVALKLLRPDVLRRRPHLVSRLCEEAMYAARIAHPNVVKVIDVTSAGPLTYVVLEFIDGVTLEKLVRTRGKLSVKTTIDVALDVVAGLRAGAAQGLIHRDVKPANILVTREGKAKIVDLGLAHSGPDSSDRGEATASRPMFVGTRGYIAPEQKERPEHVDFRADVYSLGITLYQCLTGTLPDDPIDPSRIPSPLSSIIARMTAHDRDARHASYDALESDLRALLQG